MGVGPTQGAEGGAQEASKSNPSPAANNNQNTIVEEVVSPSDSADFELSVENAQIPSSQACHSRRVEWLLLEEIGAGGMATVYIAAPRQHNQATPNIEHNRFYVAKIQRVTAGDDVQRLDREMQILQMLEGKGFPFFVDEILLDDGRRGFVMARIRGLTMKDCIANAQTSLAVNPVESSRLFRSLIEGLIRVCEFMQGAHEKHFIHRDLKPANIMIGEAGSNDVCVLDVGLGKESQLTDYTSGTDAANLSPSAYAANTDHFETQAGGFIGTPMYMAPEQITSTNYYLLKMHAPLITKDNFDAMKSNLGEVSKRTDIFQLGVILYELICGAPPSTFKNQNATLGEIINKTLEGNFEKPTPRCSLRGIAELQAIALKATQRNPADRYQSVADLLADLKAWQSQTKVTAYEESLPALKRSLYQAKHWLALRPRFDVLLKTGLATPVFGFFVYIYLNNERAQAEALANQQVETIGYQTDEALGAFIQALPTAITELSGSNTEILVSDLAAQIRALPADKLDNDAPKLNQAINDYSSVLAAARENMPGIGDAARDANRYLEEQIRALQDGREALQTRITNRQAALDQYSTFIKAAEGPISVQAYQIGITFNLSRRPGGHIPITAPLAKIPELAPIALAASQDQLTPGYFNCSGLIEQFITRVQSDLQAGNLSDLEAKEYCKAVIQLLEGWVTSRLNRTDYRWMSSGISPEEAASLGGVMSALEKLRQANSEVSSYSAAGLWLLYCDALARTSPEASTRRDATDERDRAREDLRAWNKAIEAALSEAKSAGATGDTTTLRLQRGNENHSVPKHATTWDILAYVNDLILQATPASIDQALVALQWLNENTKLPGEEEFRKEVMGGIANAMRHALGGDMEDLANSAANLAIAERIISRVLAESTRSNREGISEIESFVKVTTLVTKINQALLLDPQYRESAVQSCVDRILELTPTIYGLSGLVEVRRICPQLINVITIENYASLLSESEPLQSSNCLRFLIKLYTREGNYQGAVNRAYDMLDSSDIDPNQTDARTFLHVTWDLNWIVGQPGVRDNTQFITALSEAVHSLLHAARNARTSDDAGDLLQDLGIPLEQFNYLEAMQPGSSEILIELTEPLSPN